MFTGLVELKAPVLELRDEPPGKRLRIAAPQLAAEATLGESVCVSGCCLTVVNFDDGVLEFEAGPETLARTSLGRLQNGTFVNLERSLRLSDRLGGHLVTGHVDCTGTLLERKNLGPWSEMWFGYPRQYAGHLVEKGSITVAGVSLTVVGAESDRFSVQLIPHTLEVTTLGELKPGDVVNLETDLLAKYVERQLALGPRQ
ncbi:MAG: riboflavin synthase [Planctomycetaceae bacterium]|nr:riboflavin synthase [Planctomycetaceae bacterium]